MAKTDDATNKKIREAVARETEGLRAECVALNAQNLELRTALAKANIRLREAGLEESK